MEYVENRTFDEIEIGAASSLQRTLTEQDITLFAVMSGDINPAHVDPEYANSSRFREVIGHGMWSGALISTVLGTSFPGPGTIYLGQELRFRRPVKVGDTITVTVTAREKDPASGRLRLETVCVNQDEEVVVSGVADVIAPKEKVRRPKVFLPAVHFDDKEMRFREIMGRVKARNLTAIHVGVVFPTDVETLSAVVAARDYGTIAPVLIGPMKTMDQQAGAAGVDLGPFSRIEAATPRDALAHAMRLVQDGQLGGIMNGGMALDELIAQIVSAGALRTERRMSHVHVLDIPSYPKPLFITDTMINIAPTLSDKRDICQNAIDLARWLGIPAPKVALVAAIETINPRMPATVHAATLCKMAERGQIKGGILDGPLTFEHAVSLRAAQSTQILSPVAGNADILVAPDLESGNMLAKELMHLAGGLSAGVVLGAKAPITLTERTTDRHSWMASAALAQVVSDMYVRSAQTLEGGP